MNNDQPKCTLSNEQLIEKCRDWVSKLCKSGGRAWTLRVPVDFNYDPDILFNELGKRLAAAPRWEKASECFPENPQEVIWRHRKTRDTIPQSAIDCFHPEYMTVTFPRDDMFYYSELEWLDESAPQPVRDSVQKPDTEAPMVEQAIRTGRIHYGGYAQHVVHYVIPDDDPKYLIKVSEISRKIAGDRMVEQQKKKRAQGYTGPFGLPHHCFSFNEAVSFTVDEAGEAVIIFP